MAKYRVIFNLIREKARVCSCFARKANEERERERSREWLEANRPSDEKEREDRYGSILIRVFVDTFKSGLAAARRYACHCTRDPSPSSMTSFLAGVNLWRIWRGLSGKREWQRDLLTGMHRSPTVGGRGEGGRGEWKRHRWIEEQEEKVGGVKFARESSDGFYRPVVDSFWSRPTHPREINREFHATLPPKDETEGDAIQENFSRFSLRARCVQIVALAFMVEWNLLG